MKGHSLASHRQPWEVMQLIHSAVFKTDYNKTLSEIVFFRGERKEIHCGATFHFLRMKPKRLILFCSSNMLPY
uniref:Uncharacterized protein n=1 Tax=Anguilla anguilla TaxID=7936 RepID=A0A0E9X0S3_ANGAN